MTDSLYNDEAIIRSVTYHGKAGHKISLELDPEGWERLKGMETTRCIMLLVPIQNDGQPDPDAKPYPITAEAATRAPDKPRQRMADLSRAKQAGILCKSDEFIHFLMQRHSFGVRDPDVSPEGAADFVRGYCLVESRSMLDGKPASGERWDQLRSEFDAWRGAIGHPDERA